MTALKAHEVDAFLKRADTKTRFFLVYGPDRGLVNERCGMLAKLKNASNENESLVKIDGDSVANDPALLDDEARAISLFGGPRIVWLRVDGKSVDEPVEHLLSDPPQDVTLIIEAGDLKPTSLLRKLFEKASHAITLPCYADDARALNAVIDDELQQAGMRIEPAARKLLLDQLGGDRQATRQEIRKLCLYALHDKIITTDDIAALSGDVSALALDQIFDPLGLGDTVEALSETQRHLSAGTHGSVLLQLALRHMMTLQALRFDVDNGRTTTDAIKSAAPPIFFKRQPLIERQLAKWSLDKIDRALTLLNDAVLKTRLLPQLTEALTERALIDVSLLAKGR